MTKTIGQTIKEIRERYNFSQAEIAESLGINRVVLANIESDKRKLKPYDPLITKIANFFEITEEELRWEVTQCPSIPYDDQNYKLKNTILYILSKCWQKPNIWKTVLNKLLYFSDFNYYEFKWESITWETYKKLPRWPVPENIENVLEDMEEKWQITRINSNFCWYEQIRYIPNINYDLSEFNWLQIKIIDNVVDRLSNMTATQISDYSHEDIPYKATRNPWDEISYQLAMYREWDYIANTENDD